MQREFFAHFTFLHARSDIQRAAMDFLLGKGKVPDGLRHLADVVDPLARIDLLAQALLTSYKDHARAGSRREGGGLPEFFRSRTFQDAMDARYKQMNALGLIPALPDLDVLPVGSFALRFTFALRTPYISHDDVSLHILDNPVRKDRIFRLPMVASTTWKGVLRAAIRESKGWNDDHPDILRLFGETREDQAGHAGRLIFYPTFFTRISLEVINPHDRQSNAGKQPIYFESVPAGAQGTFSLLYVPFDLIGAAEAEIRQQALADLKLVAEGLQALFLTYGFSAKRTSGFGVAEERLTDGVLTGRFPGLAAPAPTQPWPTWTFGSFTELADIPAKIAQQRQGGTP